MPIVESNQSDSYHDKTSGNVARKKVISDEELSRLMHNIKAKQREVF